MQRPRRPPIGAIIGLGLLAAAVVRELRTPAAARTWHGRIGGFVPYDLRRPTLRRFRQTVWNPDAPLLVGSPFGVGWILNPGRLFRRG
jgi:hypothetical protein